MVGWGGGGEGGAGVELMRRLVARGTRSSWGGLMFVAASATCLHPHALCLTCRCLSCDQEVVLLPRYIQDDRHVIPLSSI